MGGGGEGSDEDGREGVDTGNDVQGGGSYGDILREQEFDSNRGNADGTVEVSTIRWNGG